VAHARGKRRTAHARVSNPAVTPSQDMGAAAATRRSRLGSGHGRPSRSGAEAGIDRAVARL
jgi:hypothetical protein